MTKLIKFLSFQVHSLFHKFIAVLIARFYLFIQDPIFNKRIGCDTNVNTEKKIALRQITFVHWLTVWIRNVAVLHGTCGIVVTRK